MRAEVLLNNVTLSHLKGGCNPPGSLWDSALRLSPPLIPHNPVAASLFWEDLIFPCAEEN